MVQQRADAWRSPRSVIDEVFDEASGELPNEEGFLGGWLGGAWGSLTGQVRFPSGAMLSIVSGRDGPGEEHFDPNGTGNPLLDVSGSNKSVQLSTNFRISEFAPTDDAARIDPKIVECLQAIRTRVGKAVTITSGYRSYAYNTWLYTTKYNKPPTKSRHISGQAADVKIAGMTGMQIAKTALEVCGCDLGLGIANTYAHVDVRGTYTRWTYLSGAASTNAIAELDRHRSAVCG